MESYLKALDILQARQPHQRGKDINIDYWNVKNQAIAWMDTLMSYCPSHNSVYLFRDSLRSFFV